MATAVAWVVCPTVNVDAVSVTATFVTTGVGTVTVMAALPLVLPSVAVIVAVPAVAPPVTSPALETVATLVLLDFHVKLCPLIVLPF